MGFKLDMYNHLDALEVLNKVRGISDIFYTFKTSAVSDFYVILQFLATLNIIKSVETLLILTLNMCFDRIYHFAKFYV